MSHDATSDQSGGEDLWLEFCQAETADGHTFDPLQFLLASREYGEFNGQSWESIYREQPIRMARDLLYCLGNYPDALKQTGDFNSAILSVTRLADTLPVAYGSGSNAYGSKNGILEDLFWSLFNNGDYVMLADIFAKGQDIFIAESATWMLQALKNPGEYKARLERLRHKPNE